jgi:thymidylate kinase
MDGTGKTTVARQLARLEGVAVIHAIRAHDDPQSPYAQRSRHLAAASAAADAIGHAQLKVAVLYLQLCLYGPQERRAAAPVLVADRHPLVDPLVYLPLYARIAADDDPGADVDRWWAAQPPETARVVRDWLRECSGGTDAWAVGAELIRLAAEPPAGMLAELGRRFAVELPDQVVLLELPVAEALERARSRSAGAELHETAALLTAVRAAYDTTLEWLGGSVTVHRVDCSGRSVEEVAAAVARHAVPRNPSPSAHPLGGAWVPGPG